MLKYKAKLQGSLEMDFKLIQTLNELQTVENEYNSLLERIEDYQVFYEYEWIKNYILYYPDFCNNKKYQLQIVTGWLNQQMVLCCPFCLYKKELHFICEEATDYNTILVDKSFNVNSLLSEMWEYILANIKFNKICLKEFRASNVLYNFYTITDTKFGGKSFLKITTTAAYSNLPEDESKITKSERSNIKRRTKKLLQNYDVKFEVFDYLTQEDLQFITPIRDKQFGKNIFTNGNSWKFFLELNKALPNNFVVYKLFLHGELSALSFCFKDAQKIYSYCTLYDSKYKKEGLGQILRSFIIQDIIKNGGKKYDFMRGAEAHKAEYCDNIVPNFTLTAFPASRKNKIRVFLYKSVRYVSARILGMKGV